MFPLKNLARRGLMMPHGIVELYQQFNFGSGIGLCW